MRGWITLLLLGSLSGCQWGGLQTLQRNDDELAAQWLALSAATAALTPEQAASVLQQVSEGEAPDARFRYALLNQQLGQRDGWVVARDRLRALKNDPALPVDARQLAALLERFNQAQINHAQQLAELQQQGTERAAEVARLQEQIRALTNLEDSMRQRKRSSTP